MAKNTEVESSLNSLITANHTDLVAIEATADLILAKNTEIEATADLILAKNTEIEALITTSNSGLNDIDSGIEGLDSLLGDIQTDTNDRLDHLSDDLETLNGNNNNKLDHLSGDLDTLNGKIDTLTNRIKLANSDTHIAVSLEDIGGVATQTTVAAILAKNTEVEAELGLIKQAVELIDNAVDGDYLNVNQNIAGTDVSSNSGNKDDQTQRFCLATDDVPTGLTHSILNAINGSVGTGNATLVNIKTALELLDNALDGDYLNVNQNIAGTDVSSNSGNKDAQTQRFCLATDDVPTGLTHSILNAVNGSIGTGNTALTAIKTAVELLDNALDGNYLNVNQNIAGTDVSSNSGNKDDQTQRVVIATDDIPFQTLNTHLSEIEDAVETLQACVDSNKVKVQFEAGDLNIGNVDVVSSALPSGASTESSLTAMSAKLPNSLGPKGNGASISTCRSSTAGEYDMTGRTTIGTPGTSTKLLCDAQGHLQVDVLSGGSTDVSGLATHAKQDIIIGHVDGIEGLLGTTNSGISSILAKNTEIESTADGILAKNTEMETSLNSILSKNSEIESSMNSLISANHTDLVALASKLDVLETSLTRIEPKEASSTYLAGGNVGHGNAISGTIVDTDGYRYMTVFAKASNSNQIVIQYSNTNNAGNMVSLPQTLNSTSINGIYVSHIVLEHPARYVRFVNFSGSTINALTLYYQLSN